MTMIENVIMFEELSKKLNECDILTYYNCAYSIAVISDDCFHDVYVYDKDNEIPQWSFVGEFCSSDWKKMYSFIDYLVSIRSPFDSHGGLKRDEIPF